MKAYYRERREAMKQHVPEQRLKKAWANFSAFQKYQLSILQVDSDNTALEYAIDRLPRLEEIELVAGNINMSLSTLNAYSECLVTPCLQPTMEMGVRQLKGLLEAASIANRSLLRIEADQIGCRFFGLPFELFRDALRSLQFLELNVYSLDGEAFPVYPSVVVSEDRIGEFLQLAYNLKELELTFEGWCLGEYKYRVKGPDIDSTLAACNWHQLVKLKLDNVISSEDVLIDFFRRHSQTLKHVTLHDYDMTREGKWSEVFWQMRQHLSLDSALIHGNFMSYGGNYLRLHYDDSEHKESRGKTISRMVCGNSSITRENLEEVLLNNHHVYP